MVESFIQDNGKLEKHVFIQVRVYLNVDLIGGSI
jgi:hypothetical protein